MARFSAAEPRPRPGPGSAPQDGDSLNAAFAFAQALKTNLSKVLLGSPAAVDAASLAALTGGHLLIEDIPGVGKTVLARALAKSLGVELARIQGHPDLLPSDVTGVSVFSPATGTWEFRRGPVFSHVVLLDELNRTPPRSQSALLETMEEGQVSVDGTTWPLPRPHLVIATQNPLSQRGTYPLVESQLDRFALATDIGYPDADTETRLTLHQGGKSALDTIEAVTVPAAWLEVQQAVERVTVHEAVARYAIEVCRASRQLPGVLLGASPRAGIWLIRSAQASAVLAGRPFVLADDVKAVAVPALAHRLVGDTSLAGPTAGDTSGATAAGAIRSLLASVPVPRP